MRYRYAVLALMLPLRAPAQPPGPVVFSELMWMGSHTSAADEWLELYNRGSSELSLDGWVVTRLVDGADKPMLQLKGRIEAGGVYLAANYAADEPRSHLAARPQLVSSALSLPNTRLRLRLYDADRQRGGRLVDTADDGVGEPMAGDAQAKRAMVRVRPEADGTLVSSWATASESSGWDEGAVEKGTPGTVSWPSSSAVLEDPPEAVGPPAVDGAIDVGAAPPSPPSPEPSAPPSSAADLVPSGDTPDPSGVRTTGWGHLKRGESGR